MNKIRNISENKKKYSLIIAFFIFCSIPPWFVWGLDVWNMRVISLITIYISIKILNKSNLRNNLIIANLFLITVLYTYFGGVKGYMLPTHVQMSIYIFLLSMSKDFLNLILYKFEKILIYVFFLGVIIYLISVIVKLPSFTIPPLNKGKMGNYDVRLFDLEFIDYTIRNSRQFMSVFDEPGVVGTLVAMLISYREIKFNTLKDILLIVSGLITFSLAFYIVLFINLIYNRSLNIKFYLMFLILIGGFYFMKPLYVKEVLFDRFILGNDFGIVDNRTSEEFDIKYNSFVKKGGFPLIFGNGPNAMTDLSKEIELNLSSYKSTVYKHGVFGTILFVFFFFYCTLTIAPIKRGWFFLLIYIMLAWQRPGVFQYFNIMIFLSGLAYISLNEKQHRMKKLKSLQFLNTMQP